MAEQRNQSHVQAPHRDDRIDDGITPSTCILLAVERPMHGVAGAFRSIKFH